MDKEILRIVIILVGVVVIAGMILWDFFKKKNKYGTDRFAGRSEPLQRIDESLKLHPENDEFDVVPLNPEFGGNNDMDPISSAAGEDFSDNRSASRGIGKIPALIQFSIVANSECGFNGAQLQEAFKLVGLEYGQMGVYERVDDNRLVDFAVASMVEPGTFPAAELDDFSCPGITFFMQPGEVSDAAAVFDDFVRTITILANELNGVRWDHHRRVLTDKTIEQFRQLLS